MTDFLKVYFMKNQFYLVISLWGVTEMINKTWVNNI